jgi:hypothetical protein
MTRANFMPGILASLGAAVLGVALIGIAPTSVAGELVSSDDLIEQLTPKGERGLASVGIVGPAINLTIQFDFNAATLTATARQQLDNVGLALSSEQLANFDFLLVGHTDAVGSRSYNQALSEQRAASVHAYLVDKYDLGDGRIFDLGMGEDNLRYLDDPENADNRRVELRNIGDSEAKLLRGGAGSAPIVNTNTITSETSVFCLTMGSRPEFAILDTPAVDQQIVVRRRTTPQQVMNAIWPAGVNAFAWPSDWPPPEEGRYIWAVGSGGTAATELLYVEGNPSNPHDKAAAYHVLGCEAQLVAAFNEIVAASQ